MKLLLIFCLVSCVLFTIGIVSGHRIPYFHQSYTGAGVKTQRAIDSRQCYAICKRNPKCSYWSFSIKPGKCVLYSSVGGMKPKKGVVSGDLASATNSETTTGGQIVCDADLVKELISNVSTSSIPIQCCRDGLIKPVDTCDDIECAKLYETGGFCSCNEGETNHKCHPMWPADNCSYCKKYGCTPSECSGCTYCGGCNKVVDGDFGGNSGNPFTDISYTRYGYPTQLRIRSGNFIDAIQVGYCAVEAVKHGGNGGQMSLITLETGEMITEFEGIYDEYQGNYILWQLKITTNLDNTFGPYGNGSGSGTAFKSERPGCSFSFVSGRSGRFLDDLSINWCC